MVLTSGEGFLAGDHQPFIVIPVDDLLCAFHYHGNEPFQDTWKVYRSRVRFVKKWINIFSANKIFYFVRNISHLLEYNDNNGKWSAVGRCFSLYGTEKYEGVKRNENDW